jgi:hypothetical protein
LQIANVCSFEISKNFWRQNVSKLILRRAEQETYKKDQTPTIGKVQDLFCRYINELQAFPQRKACFIITLLRPSSADFEQLKNKVGGGAGHKTIQK